MKVCKAKLEPNRAQIESPVPVGPTLLESVIDCLSKGSGTPLEIIISAPYLYFR